jgi:hypothetical protein
MRYDLAPDGKRVAVLTPVESPKQEHEIVMLQNTTLRLRRRSPDAHKTREAQTRRLT